MSLRFAFWKWRVQRRLRDDRAVFAPDKLGVVNPADVRVAVRPEARAALQPVLAREFYPGDWDLSPVAVNAGSGAANTPGTTPDMLTVCIGRSGQVLAYDGLPVLAQALAAGAQSMPVRIAGVHPRWRPVRNAIMNFIDAHKGFVYQKIPHPDLGRIPARHGDERIEFLRAHLPCKSGAVLDIGANWGYWSHQFEMLGFSCYAVDHNPKNIFYMQRIHDAMARRFVIHPGSIFDYYPPKRPAIVLALNVFHHFLKQQFLFEHLQALLRRLDFDHMFFEAHRPEEFAGMQVYRNLTPGEFVEFIRTETKARTVQPLGAAQDGRALFLLSKV